VRSMIRIFRFACSRKVPKLVPTSSQETYSNQEPLMSCSPTGRNLKISQSRHQFPQMFSSSLGTKIHQSQYPKFSCQSPSIITEILLFHSDNCVSGSAPMLKSVVLTSLQVSTQISFTSMKMARLVV